MTRVPTLWHDEAAYAFINYLSSEIPMRGDTHRGFLFADTEAAGAPVTAESSITQLRPPLLLFITDRAASVKSRVHYVIKFRSKAKVQTNAGEIIIPGCKL